MPNRNLQDITEHRLQAAGRLAAIRHRIEGYRSRLERLSIWRPSVNLAHQAAEAARLVDAIGRRLERKLVVTLIGPSGSGKSTLLNALAGVDGLSPVGVDRPTTRDVVVFGKDRDDADAFSDRIGGAQVRMRTTAAAGALEHLILVDTPDTDSREAELHREVLDRVIGESDVLLCVFDAENPKRRDHVDFLAPYVQRFDGESLLAVLNRCDRLSEQELAQRILPEFSAHLQGAWSRDVDTVFCTSAHRATILTSSRSFTTGFSVHSTRPDSWSTAA
jgi:energy-coupling factor transporter ATP-binding protein EcfA2